MGMSDGGAQYLDIAFKADDGRLCFSRLFLSKKDGSEAFGRRILDALLVVCNAQKADVCEGKVYTRDRNGRAASELIRATVCRRSKSTTSALFSNAKTVFTTANRPIR